MGSRIIVETSSAKKRQLDRQLTLLGQTVTQWVDEALDEVVQAPTSDQRCLLGLADQDVIAALEALDWEFRDSSTNYLTHDLHPYPAKFIPQIPQRLIAALSHPGEVIWDPFSGSGTTAVEALLAGREAIGTDANPLSAIIGAAKCATLDLEGRDYLLSIADQFESLADSTPSLEAELEHTRIDRAAIVPDIPNIEHWFTPSVIAELSLIRLRIDALTDPLLAVARVALSKLIVRVSNQDSETRYSSRKKNLVSGSVLRIFGANLRSTVKRCMAAGKFLRYRTAKFGTLNIGSSPTTTYPPSVTVAPGSIDFVITSPPYPNATDYHLYHRFRLFWLGYDPRALGRIEIGSHLRHQKEQSGIAEYVSEMTVAIGQIFAALRPGRYATMVVGDGIYTGTTYNTADMLAHAATLVGFDVVGTIQRKISTMRRSFIAAARRASTEEILILKRPETENELVLSPPPYKLWKFEHALRIEEVKALTTCRDAEISRAKSGALHLATQCADLRSLRLAAYNGSISNHTMSPVQTWSAILEANGHDRRSRNSKYATHGLHAYKGKYYPQLARCLINICSGPEASTVLDPFCGSGTTLLEAYLTGRRSYGVDLNPLAVLIAQAKLAALTINPVVYRASIHRFLASLANLRPLDPSIVFDAELLPEMTSWFPLPVLKKLASIRVEIEKMPDPRIRDFLLVVLSSLVRKVSNQEPKDLRIRRRLEPIEDAHVYELFAARLREQLSRVLHLVRAEGCAPAIMHDSMIVHGDCRNAETYSALGLRSVDCVVTSPPYSTALPYIDTDRLSLLLVHGLSKGDRNAIERSLLGNREVSLSKRKELDAQIDGEVFHGVSSETAIALIRRLRRVTKGGSGGFRVQNTPGLLLSYFCGMSRAISVIANVLREDGKAAFVIGDSMTFAGGKATTIPTTRCLVEMCDAAGLRLWKSFKVDVTTQDQLHVGNAIRKNAALIFTKS